MKLYIANCTVQHHDFHWRQKGDRQTKVNIIKPAQQIKLGNDNWTKEDIDRIVKQHGPYGLIHVRITRALSTVSMCRFGPNRSSRWTK